MPTWTTLSIFLLAALGLLFLPGPAVLFVMTKSVDQGRRVGAVSSLGIGIADLIHTTAAAFGLSALLVTSALAFNVVKYLGAAYLIYLGIRTLLKRDTPHQTVSEASQSLTRLFTQGMFVELLNPKTALFFLAFLPQFVDPAQGNVTLQFLLLGSLYTILGICSLTFYGLIAGTTAALLKRSTTFQRVQRYITGCIYIALGLTAAFASTEKK
ncbi:threonine/homoserine/homoserine lactone efflux protein [Thermosporothrix hazakensis]|jgi:threonine/homoserine/homoserine lactone efflux protein|uniref:Threonine/homoserine/homoserine lactone efflux protein n=1 Tax=Thermosporothrix hazakensis TaxID=644383 RepID=A0A326UBB0_THEHA|nr:LysE family translocator [Thermosporothrix hazakensis]PZW32665.1 threonine/homoserine/homoserine lactone efflux protein [Thermosporothrix hazakensis]GCE50017.1 RhtB family transporter [Thermosporothrix hazakensis]